MDNTLIILRYADGAIGLTGWGWLIWFNIVIAIYMTGSRGK